MSLKSKSSSGLDDIPSTVLKIVNEDTLLAVIALSHIFNLSLKQGKFINAFKVTKIIPIYKTGSRSDVNNYRPISLSPVLSKVLEIIVHNRLYSFLCKQIFFFMKHSLGSEKINLLHRLQHC